ncbi:hypothetical protein ACKWTF_012529 [Chironomus riparius]
MEINNFPEELLVMIFEYVSDTDLCNLALVCKNFNNAVNNSSSLVHKFKVTLNHRRAESRWIGSRKYVTFKITGCNKKEFERYVGVFSKYGEHVKYLTLESNSFNLGSLKVLFVLCPNIQRVFLRHNNIDQTTDYPFVLRYLYAIDYEGESLPIEKFKMSSYISILILSGNQNYPEAQTERFLAMQRRLTKLRLIDFNSNAFFFASPHFHDAIQFRLECLSLVNVSLPENPRLFRFFLNHHKDTLNYLEIGNLSYDILEYFTNFKKLKTIKFTSIFEREFMFIHNLSDTPMNQVENLIIDCQNIINIATKFPNLINLEIYRVKINPGEIMQLQHLQSLTITESKNISSLTNLNARKIKFESCHFTGTKILTTNRRFIQKLSIINCKNVKWLSDFMDYEYLNLKRFEITGTMMSKKLHGKIMKIERKIEKCIVPSNQVMSDFQAFKQSMETCLECFMNFITCLCVPEF